MSEVQFDLDRDVTLDELASEGHLPLIDSYLATYRRTLYTSQLSSISAGGEIGPVSYALASDADAYEICRRDADFQQGDSIRRRDAAGLVTRIISTAEGDQREDDYAGLMQEVVDGIRRFTSAKYQLASCIFRGFSLGYIQHEPRFCKIGGIAGRWMVPVKIIDIDPRRYRLANYHGGPTFRAEIYNTNRRSWVPIDPRWPLIRIVYNDEEAHLSHGRGELDTVYRYVWAKSASEQLGLRSLETFASGVWTGRIANLDFASADKAALQRASKMLRVMKQMRSINIGIVGGNDEINVGMPNTAGSSGALEREKYYGDLIKQVCLGSVMHAGGGGDKNHGGRAQAETEQSTADSLTSWDRSVLDEELRWQLLGWFTRANRHLLYRQYGECALPKVSSETENKESLSDKINGLVQTAGIAKIDSAHWYNTVQQPIPDGVGPTVGGPPEQPDMFGGMGGEEGVPAEGDGQVSDEDFEKALTAGEETEQPEAEEVVEETETSPSDPIADEDLPTDEEDAEADDSDEPAEDAIEWKVQDLRLALGGAIASRDRSLSDAIRRQLFDLLGRPYPGLSDEEWREMVGASIAERESGGDEFAKMTRDRAEMLTSDGIIWVDPAFKRTPKEFRREGAPIGSRTQRSDGWYEKKSEGPGGWVRIPTDKKTGKPTEDGEGKKIGAVRDASLVKQMARSIAKALGARKEQGGKHHGHPDVSRKTNARGARKAEIESLVERGVDPERAETLYKAAEAFTENSTPIRMAQRGTFVGSEEDRQRRVQQGEDIEEWIKAKGGFDPGTVIVRGITVPKEMAEELFKPGNVIDQQGAISSWTTNDKVAVGFVNARREPPYINVRGVILEAHGGIRGSASVRGVSAFPKEDEVIVSKDAKLRVDSAQLGMDGIMRVRLYEERPDVTDDDFDGEFGRKKSPEGTISKRKDGDYRMTNGTWQKVSKPRRRKKAKATKAKKKGPTIDQVRRSKRKSVSEGRKSRSAPLHSIRRRKGEATPRIKRAEGWGKATKAELMAAGATVGSRAVKAITGELPDAAQAKRLRAAGRAYAEKPAEHWGGPDQPYFKPGPNPTVDALVTRDGPNGLEVLVIQRGEGTVEGGKWALPGGFHDSAGDLKAAFWEAGKETPQQAALRELMEETKLDASDVADSMRHVGTYDEHGRDPRDNDEAWAISNTYAMHLNEEQAQRQVEGSDDAQDAQWVPVEKLPADLAFDHGKMLDRGLPVGTRRTRADGVYVKTAEPDVWEKDTTKRESKAKPSKKKGSAKPKEDPAARRERIIGSIDSLDEKGRRRMRTAFAVMKAPVVEELAKSRYGVDTASEGWGKLSARAKRNTLYDLEEFKRGQAWVAILASRRDKPEFIRDHLAAQSMQRIKDLGFEADIFENGGTSFALAVLSQVPDKVLQKLEADGRSFVITGNKPYTDAEAHASRRGKVSPVTGSKYGGGGLFDPLLGQITANGAPDNTIAHEIGHAIDYTVKSSTEAWSQKDATFRALADAEAEGSKRAFGVGDSKGFGSYVMSYKRAGDRWKRDMFYSEAFADIVGDLFATGERAVRRKYSDDIVDAVKARIDQWAQN